MCTKVISLLQCIAIVLSVTSPLVESLYTIVEEQLSGNLIKLTCRKESGLPFNKGSASFFLNRTELKFSGSPPATPDSVVFIPNRLLDEGEYSCGPSLNEQSENTVPIIGSTEVESCVFNKPLLVRVKRGTTAVLHPFIEPGLWHSRYHIDWTKGSYLVGRIDGLRQTLATPIPLDERFTVNKADFSLQIRNVSFDDAGNYTGALGVKANVYIHKIPYKQTQYKEITLLVYDHPNITHLSSEKIVEPNMEVNFSCTAVGYPRPTISWEHNSLIVSHNVSPTHKKYSLLSTIETEDTTRSTIVIHSVGSWDSGAISCVAKVDLGGGLEHLVTRQTTLLSLNLNSTLATHEMTESDKISQSK